ncbi:MAG: hypothetical protein IT259_03940 [Saprospiraceae bacterium]|nr:hypothetical protein [Saprospiraceae bacterium]
MKNTVLVPLVYFGFFAAWLAGFSHNDPFKAGLFMLSAALFAWQILRPSVKLGYLVWGLALVFSITYAASLIRILTDNFRPFNHPETQILFGLNIALAIANLVFIVFWTRNSAFWGVMQQFFHRTGHA